MKSIRLWSKVDRFGAMFALRIGTREGWLALEGAGTNPLRAGFKRTGAHGFTARVRLGRIVFAGGVW